LLHLGSSRAHDTLHVFSVEICVFELRCRINHFAHDSVFTYDFDNNDYMPHHSFESIKTESPSADILLKKGAYVLLGLSHQAREPGATKTISLRQITHKCRIRQTNERNEENRLHKSEWQSVYCQQLHQGKNNFICLILAARMCVL